jgi:uncharacterized protein (TIGR03382 family)
VLNMVPVQVDACYRTGASAVVISVLAMALASGSLAFVILRTTGSAVAAWTGAILLMSNPNVVYLQSTPMTEPLLFGLTLWSIAATVAWIDRESSAAPWGTALPGAALACACLTRYEAWPITGMVLVLALAVLLRRGIPFAHAAARVGRLALWPAMAILVFSANSRWVVGAWFVSGDFFVPENIDALGHPLAAWKQVREGLALLAGPWSMRVGYLGIAVLLRTWTRSAQRAPAVLLIALFAAAALPVAAYTQGHPFRIRYDVPLVIASAAVAAAGIGLLWRIVRVPAALLVILLAGRHAFPIDHNAPLVVESQREAVNMAGRRAITAYLQAHYDGSGIMMSMGSLGHYMHDLSLAGFDIKDFLHEGNGEIWRFAMLRPRGHAGWLIIEGSAEGGDALHHASLRDRWLDGFEKVAEGGGATLYRVRGAR